MQGSPKLRVGLALGSGAARGWAHIGALRALDGLGIRPDVVCGTSIGALVGGFHLTGGLDELEAWARHLTKLKIFRYLDFRVKGSGMIAGNRLFVEMERRLGEVRIEELGVPFATVATDLYTGHEVWLSSGPLAEAIRASFSLPGIFEPVRVDHRWVVDGALTNPVPVSVCHALGAEAVIAINLNNNPLKSVRSQISLSARGAAPMEGIRPAWPGGLLRNAGARYDAARHKRKRKKGKIRPEDGDVAQPTVIGVLASTLNLVQDRVTRGRLAADPPDVCITPKIGHIGLLDFHTAEETIDAGANAVYQAEAEIRDALAVLEEMVS